MTDTPIDRESVEKLSDLYSEYPVADTLLALRAALDEAEAKLKTVLRREAEAYSRHEARAEQAAQEARAAALERVRVEERAKGMERAGVILLDHPHSTRWHVLKTIRAEAEAMRARGKT